MNNPLLTEDLGVYIIDMTPKVEEQVVFNEDGSYSIFINARLNQERQMLAYQHALMHIIKTILKSMTRMKLNRLCRSPSASLIR